MAQTICAVVDCALVKTNGALGAPLGFSHGASMAQRRRWAQIELIDTGGYEKGFAIVAADRRGPVFLNLFDGLCVKQEQRFGPERLRS